jgi:hypothetical protein
MCDPAVTFPGKCNEARDWYINFHVEPKFGSAFDSDPDQPLPPAAESQKANNFEKTVISLWDKNLFRNVEDL